MKAVSVTTPGFGKQLGHGADAADVFFAILGRKAQAEPLGEFLAVPLLEHAGAGVQAVADVVAVEHVAVDAPLVQLVVDQVRDGALAAGAQAGEPNHAALVAVELLALFAADAVFVPGDVGIVGHRCALLLFPPDVRFRCHS